MSTRVLLVSKAVTPPFRDGTVCFVRNLATGILRYQPTVLTTRDAPPVAPHVLLARIYPERSSFAPGLRHNARVFAHVLAERDHDLWHFVFAPNPVSSAAGHLLRSARRRPVVQTIASRPLRYDHASLLLFGDIIVALSRHTADQLIQAGASAARVEVVPAPLPSLTRSPEQMRMARQQAGLDAHAPLFVYAGDLEFSRGAATFVDAAPAILSAVPDAQLVVASRAKTPRARHAQELLQQRGGSRILFAGEVDDLPALIASATAMPFAVDDLYGKIDHPYAVLEACLLAVPPIVARGTPLDELAGVPRVAPGDAAGLADACIELAKDSAMREQIGKELRAQVAHTHAPAIVGAAYESLYDRLVAT